jgi:hypothetical protein
MPPLPARLRKPWPISTSDPRVNREPFLPRIRLTRRTRLDVGNCDDAQPTRPASEFSEMDKRKYAT